MYNPMDMTGRAFLVTGASSGLGRATAILLSRLGAKVLLLGRNAERLQQTLDNMEGEGHALLAFDLTNTEQIPEMLAEQAGKFTPFSGIVHSAGIIQLKPLHMCRTTDYELLHRINTLAAGQLLRGISKPGVVASSGCSVVIVGSIMSMVGAKGLITYATSKAAVLGLVRVAALELAGQGIRVNAVLPGSFESEMKRGCESNLLPKHLRGIAEMHPLGIGYAEDVANAIAFLLADTARWITGSYLTVDGGYIAQ